MIPENKIAELSANQLFFVAGANDHVPGDNGEHWQDIQFNNYEFSGNLGMIWDGMNDIWDSIYDYGGYGSDLGGWMYDRLH